MPPAEASKTDAKSKADGASNAATKPLAPPPRPGQGNTPDLFKTQPSGSLSLEPNPFEQSFGGGSGPETPGGTKLPPVASLTSPSSLLPGSNNTPFNWGGGSLRTGPLSPAMLSGPANDYFSDNHMRGGFTPNESSLRSGLTPGGSGSMFPASSPNSQALFAQLASGGATPNTIDFHRTALSAAAKREQATSAAVVPAQTTTAPAADMANGAAVKAEPKAFDPHDNDAANGLFLLAQGRNTGPQGQAAPAPAKGAAAKANGATEATNASDEPAKPNTRAKGKKGQAAAATNTRRKAEEPPAKAPPAKKAKGVPAPPPSDEPSEDEGDDDDENGPRSKMTDEEKRKNFLERNRYVSFHVLFGVASY